MSEVSKIVLISESNLCILFIYWIDLRRSFLDVKHDGKVGLD